MEKSSDFFLFFRSFFPYKLWRQLVNLVISISAEVSSLFKKLSVQKRFALLTTCFIFCIFWKAVEMAPGVHFLSFFTSKCDGTSNKNIDVFKHRYIEKITSMYKINIDIVKKYRLSLYKISRLRKCFNVIRGYNKKLVLFYLYSFVDKKVFIYKKV